jgi:hypothetical protein
MPLLKQSYALVLTLLCTYITVFSQSKILLHHETLTPAMVSAINQRMTKNGSWDAYSFEDRYYAILQFHHIPHERELQHLKAQGVLLFAYLPEHAYLASLPSAVSIDEINVPFAIPLAAKYKISPQMKQKLMAGSAASYEVNVFPMPDISSPSLVTALQQSGLSPGNATLPLAFELTEAQLYTLSQHPAIMWIEPVEPAAVPEGLPANSIMGNHWLSMGPGEGYDGTGTVIGIADDGLISHADFSERVVASPDINWGDHGDMVAGKAAGAGNINPRALGLAPGADIFLSLVNGYSHINNAVERYQFNNVSITSTSYAEGCGGVYNTNAAFLDAQLSSTPQIMHVFSAGNQGENSCSTVYGHLSGAGSTRYGGITGGRKASKNAIAVGNATFGNILVSSSSRGPVQDGRIKPDICAVAQGSLTTDDENAYRLGSGTSAAAPVIAGILANLTQAYRLQHQGQTPDYALLKACLLNGAQDIGRPGPDYEAGWGLVNANHALEMLEQEQYFISSVSHNGQRNHTIQIPAGAKKLKVMLYWHDKAGSPVAAKALVNDLDLRLISPYGVVKHPLVLSTATDIDSITSIASPGIDRVNNAEQVYIENPAPGNYICQVAGHSIPDGPQHYFLVFHWQAEALTLNYPAGNEQLVPGELEYISWNATGSSGTFNVQFSSNGGVSWQTIAANLPGHLRQTPWTVPDIASGECLIRVGRNSQYAQSVGHFNILGTPTFHITSAGPGTASITWQAVSGANRYDIYKLLGKYMTIIGSTDDTSFNFQLAPDEGNWYSIRARNTNGLTGRRAYAQYYKHFSCESQLDLILTLDGAPSQINWEIRDLADNVLSSGGPYNSNMAFQQLQIPVCLPEGCYTFSIHDAGNNGLCCQYGQGGYQLRTPNNLILASGTSFGSSATHNFCLEQSTPPLQVSIHNSDQTSCASSTDGWAAAFPSGGTGNYTYTWSNGAQTQQITNLPGGLYQLTVSDQVSTVVAQVSIYSPPPLSVDIQTDDNPCGESADGSATAAVTGGTPPYSYQWSNGTSQSFITAVEPGYYELTVTDANGCTQVATTYIQSTSSIEIFFFSSPPSCSNSTDASIYTYVLGNVGNTTYAWSTNGSQSYLTGIGEGIYSLTVTDSRGCSTSSSILIDAPEPLSLIANLSQDGSSVSTTVNGGTSPYTYLWSDGSTEADRQGLEGGNYTLTVTDDNGCTQTASVNIITQGPAPCESSSQQSIYNWIQAIQLDGLMAQSGNNGGYGDFTDTISWQASLTAGQTIPIKLEPGFLYNSFNVNWQIYIDLNQDGDFDDADELLFAPVNANATIEDFITIPSSATAGVKTLRVIMAFGAPPGPCESFYYGEVEDYSLIITNDINYCESGGQSTSQEWIEQVQIGDLDYYSGNDGGYGNFSSYNIQAVQGQEVFFSVSPGYQSTPYPENWSIWIDFNNNGIFNTSNELVYTSSSHTGVLNGSFIIPADATPGQTRLRVIMRWDPVYNACDHYAWGETEDYSLIIDSAAPVVDGNDIEGRSAVSLPASDNRPKVWPNPSDGIINFQYQLDHKSEITFELLTPQGQTVYEAAYIKEKGLHPGAEDLSELPAGHYIIRLKDDTHIWHLPVILL